MIKNVKVNTVIKADYKKGRAVLSDKRGDYETPEDRARQEKIAARVAQEIGCDCFMEMPYKRYDASMTITGDNNHPVLYIVEIKSRNCDFRHYPDFEISFDKYVELMNLYRHGDVDVLIVICYKDGIKFVSMSEMFRSAGKAKLRRKGRGDGRHKGDKEVMAVIERKWIHPIKELRKEQGKT